MNTARHGVHPSGGALVHTMEVQSSDHVTRVRADPYAAVCAQTKMCGRRNSDTVPWLNVCLLWKLFVSHPTFIHGWEAVSRRSTQWDRKSICCFTVNYCSWFLQVVLSNHPMCLLVLSSTRFLLNFCLGWTGHKEAVTHQLDENAVVLWLNLSLLWCKDNSLLGRRWNGIKGLF